MWQIIADKGRENTVIGHLKNNKPNDISLLESQINIGDFSITYNDKIIICVERKTWEDLACTIKDPQRKANHEKLLKLRTNVGCQIIYMIEGNPFPSPNRKFARVPFNNIQAFLDHIMIRDSCHVVHSLNPAETANRLYSLTRHTMTLKTFKQESIKGGALEILKSREELSSDVIKDKMYLAMRGVTIVSLPIIKEYPISDLFNNSINENEIANKRYASGKHLGTSRARHILSNANNVNVHIKMLAEIPQITKTTAKLILYKYSMIDILLGKVSETELAAIVKSKNIKGGIIKELKIGKKVAQKMLSII